MEGFCDLGFEPFGHVQRLAEAFGCSHDDELIAAKPADEIPDPQRVGEPAGNCHEKFVSCLVAEEIVHGLEPVEIDEADGELRVTLRIQQPLREVCSDRRPIGETSQGVVRSSVGEFDTSVVELGDVLARDHEALHSRVIDQIDDRQLEGDRVPGLVSDLNLAADPPLIG